MELRKNLRAGAHFERAFGLLRPFATSMAHTARCLLAIKLNWFHLLAVCGPQSKFYGANIFFNSGFKEALRFGPKENPNFRDSSGVWMDSFTEMALEAV